MYHTPYSTPQTLSYNTHHTALHKHCHITHHTATPQTLSYHTPYSTPHCHITHRAVLYIVISHTIQYSTNTVISHIRIQYSTNTVISHTIHHCLGVGWGCSGRCGMIHCHITQCAYMCTPQTLSYHTSYSTYNFHKHCHITQHTVRHKHCHITHHTVFLHCEVTP